MFTKHKPHASRHQHALPSPHHPPAATEWRHLLLHDVICSVQHMAHALQCIVNGDDSAVFRFFSLVI